MKTLQYFKVNCRFRSQEFKCIIGCADEKEITGDVVATIISKHFKATIPSAEISFSKIKKGFLSTLFAHNLDTYELPLY